MTYRVLTLALVLLLSAACSTRPIKVADKDGIVSSVGPVVEDADGNWTLHLSIYDFDGDPVDVQAQIKNGGVWAPLPSCDKEVAPCMLGHLRGLNTRTDFKDQQHQIGIRPGDRTLETVEFRLFALDDESDEVVWPH